MQVENKLDQTYHKSPFNSLQWKINLPDQDFTLDFRRAQKQQRRPVVIVPIVNWLSATVK